jgi:hypothetical protein
MQGRGYAGSQQPARVAGIPAPAKGKLYASVLLGDRNRMASNLPPGRPTIQTRK